MRENGVARRHPWRPGSRTATGGRTDHAARVTFGTCDVAPLPEKRPFSGVANGAAIDTPPDHPYNWNKLYRSSAEIRISSEILEVATCFATEDSSG